MADADLNVEVSGEASVDRIIQVAGDHYEAPRPPAEPTFPQWIGVPEWTLSTFVGRETELSDLDAHVAEGEATVITQVAYGLGGIGKTTLAAEYCRRSRHSYDMVRWLDAESRDALVLSYIEIAAAVGVDISGLATDDAMARVRAWFEGTERSWLLVFDNVEHPATLNHLVPHQGNGRIIVTSRYADWSGTNVRMLDVDVLPLGDATNLLCAVAEREPTFDAEALAEHLDRLPIVLEHAGAFCRETGWSFAKYQQNLDTRSADILARTPARLQELSRRDLTVLTVWDQSVELAVRDVELARALLSVMAYVGADFLPKEVLVAPVAAKEAILRHGDEIHIGAALAALGRYSLIRLRREEQTGEILGSSVHRVVQDATRLSHARTGQTATSEALSSAVHLIQRAFPWNSTDVGTWERCAVIEPHLLAVVEHASRADVEKEGAYWLLDRYGTYVQYAGNPVAAPSIFERAVGLAMEVHGSDHPDTLMVRANLASSYWSAGRTDDATALFETVLADSERILGSDHPDTLMARANLATSYWSGGRNDEAIALLEGVLADRERLLGPDHPDTLMTRSNLAGAYWSAGRTGEATALFEEVVGDGERLLGSDHPDTLTTRSNLASSYWSAGRTGEATALFEEVVGDGERLLGSDHPVTLTARSNLAGAYWSAGRTDEAVALFEVVLADRERILGPDHPVTLSTRSNLAGAYWSAGRTGEAVALYEVVLADRERILGPDHPDTNRTRDFLEQRKAST